MTKKAVTMSDIAKVMNVSTVTVSKALGDRDGVSVELRERIKQKATEMGYRVHAGSHGAKDGLTYNIGIIVAKHFISDASSFYWIVYRNIVELLQNQNYYGMLEVVDNRSMTDPNAIEEIPNTVLDHKVDGLIVLGQLSEEYIDRLMTHNLPTVFLDFYGSREDADAVLSDSFYGAYMLTSHLIENGHRRIGFLGSISSTSSIQDRYLGYYKALLENRIPLRQDWVIGDRSNESDIFPEFTLPKEMPTAFVCNCDETAYKLVNQLKAAGYAVPDDISVVGYDNHIYSTICNPRLTTIDVNSRVMSAEAVDIILHKIRDGNYRRGRTLVTGKLVRRGSVKNLNEA
ncbi:MAG: LacI family DNA-binding transcriptional regulator [Oscillospiraceae bacterium]|nr:LacI family DNA-binding transcriptional regulator [Oscillospiraceae bacterium]